ncbi:NHL repeat containing protein [Oopsacas minuta]|uniref:NHL repeat containing protein n=1 Tax=Oopsacas minuta TaxID=111878 RepID=A0AAV7KKF4_9METZ|nr:NHL repeat containing protein [Oopsacas minuta]
MATQFPGPIPVPIVDPLEQEINQSIDRMIFLLNQRRIHLLTNLRNKQEETRANQVAYQEMKQQLEETRALVEGRMTHNKLHSISDRFVAEMQTKLAELHLNTPPPHVLRFLCDTQDLERSINRLGEISQQEIHSIPHIPVIPKYANFQQPIVAVGKKGSAPGEFNGSRGVAIEPESGHIYVADVGNSRIQIFSQSGDYLNHFGNQHLKYPWGILIHEDNIYVTDIEHHAIFLYELPELTMIKRVGKEGSGSEEFNIPKQPAISPNTHLYVPDRNNNRLQILTTNLVFQDTLRHQTMTTPIDVKYTTNEMFVLSWKDNPCIHVFTLSGEKSRTLLTRGTGKQVEGASFFCLDGHNNIIISDYWTGNIKVFSPEGDLLHEIGQRGHKAGMCCVTTALTEIKEELRQIKNKQDFILLLPNQSDARVTRDPVDFQDRPKEGQSQVGQLWDLLEKKPDIILPSELTAFTPVKLRPSSAFQISVSQADSCLGSKLTNQMSIDSQSITSLDPLSSLPTSHSSMVKSLYPQQSILNSDHTC